MGMVLSWEWWLISVIPTLEEPEGLPGVPSQTSFVSGLQNGALFLPIYLHIEAVLTAITGKILESPLIADKPIFLNCEVKIA